jgi:maltose alpha-D-glucosyltransferase/alpha-amylase
MGANVEAKASAFGLPRAQSLYGPLPAQLKNPESFASRVRSLVAARRKYRVAEGELLAVPEPSARGILILLLKLPEHPLAVTALNFSRVDADVRIDLSTVKEVPAGEWTDIVTGKSVGKVAGGQISVSLPGLTGSTFVSPAR